MTVDKSKFNEIQEIPKGGLLNIQRANGGVLAFDDVEYVPSGGGGGPSLSETLYDYTPSDPQGQETITLRSWAPGETFIGFSAFVVAAPSAGRAIVDVTDDVPNGGQTRIIGLNQRNVIGLPLGAMWMDIPTTLPLTYSGVEHETISYDGRGFSSIQTLSALNNPPDSGTWTLALGAHTTASLAFDISNADLQAALEALPNIGAGNVAVTDGPLAASNVTPITVTFRGALALHAVDDLVVNNGTLANVAMDFFLVQQVTTQVGIAPATGDVFSLRMRFLTWQPKWS